MLTSPRKFLVIGATSAIAQETAKLFAGEGGRFFLVGRVLAKLEIIAADLRVRGASEVACYAMDLNDFSAHESLVENARQTMGGLDMVLVAHGTLADQKKCELDFAQAYDEYKTNFLSVVSVLTHVSNYFESEKSGCIVVISSVAGDRGRQSNYIYGSAKGGLSVFLQGLRNRLYPAGVQVITVKPGFVDTPMTANFKKGLLWVGPAVVARGIYKAVKTGKQVTYLPWFWALIMLVIKIIPERLFVRLKL